MYRNQSASSDRLDILRALGIWMVLSLAGLSLSGCTPSLYSIDMRYQPSGAAVTETAGGGKVRITVATFEDRRQTADTMMIGRVIRPTGSQAVVAPKYRSPQDTVANGFKDYVASLGFTVSGDKPRWNGNIAALPSEWGDVLIGGSIDELDVTCNSGLAKTTYTSQIKLTVFFADIAGKRIFYKTTAQSSAALDHVFFSQDTMQQQLNKVLAAAIEKVFEGGKVQRMLRERAASKP